VSDHVSHPYTTTDNIIIILYILILIFLDSKLEGQKFWAEWQQALPKFGMILM